MTYTLQDLPPVLGQAFREKMVFSQSGEKVALHSNISEEEAICLYGLIRELQPQVSVEIGFAQGISTLSILGALKDNGKGQHHVIDPLQREYENCGVTMVRKAGLDPSFTFYEKFAEEVIHYLPPIQFAFVDSSHLFDLTILEFVLVDKKLDVGGIIGFHDLWMPALQSVVRYILNNRDYRLHSSMETRSGNYSSFMTEIKQGVSELLRKIPLAEKYFSSGLLNPWSTFNLPNMVFLEKTGMDSREWAFHRSF